MTGTNAPPVRVQASDDGALWRVSLARPKANVLDTAMIKALTGVFVEAAGSRDLKVVCIEGEGPHFSFGASVQEHRLEQVADMLRAFHGLFHRIAEAAVTTLAAVRGQCLGGGLELAAFCDRVFAAPDAMLGQPELKLGVFAPVGSLVLRERMGLPAATDLCLTGRSLTAEQAAAAGLVDEVADDPGAAALEYARNHLLAHSASSLRHAVRAVRCAFHEEFFARLAELEQTYTTELMATTDAVEGIAAFLEKRPPKWRNA